MLKGVSWTVIFPFLHLFVYLSTSTTYRVNDHRACLATQMQHRPIPHATYARVMQITVVKHVSWTPILPFLHLFVYLLTSITKEKTTELVLQLRCNITPSCLQTYARVRQITIVKCVSWTLILPFLHLFVYLLTSITKEKTTELVLQLRCNTALSRMQAMHV
jgi:hypothetical protein